MIIVNFENVDKNLCVICSEPTVTNKLKLTCGDNCHDKFVEFCEWQYGISKRVVDQTTGISYKVPTRDIVEKGLKWKDLVNYPRWEEQEIV